MLGTKGISHYLLPKILRGEDRAAMMGNSVCQLDWNTGCHTPGWTLFLGSVCRGVLEDQSIWICSLNKGDCLPHCRWEFPNPVGTWMVQKDWAGKTLPPSPMLRRWSSPACRPGLTSSHSVWRSTPGFQAFGLGAPIHHWLPRVSSFQTAEDGSSQLP